MSALDQAREILAKCLFVSPSDIKPSDIISEIKPIDSLAFENLMLEVEEITGESVEPTDVLDLKTVSDLASLIDKKSNR